VYYGIASGSGRSAGGTHARGSEPIPAAGQLSNLIMDSEQRAKERKPDQRTPEEWKRIASRRRIAWMVAMALPAADFRKSLLAT